METVTIQNGFEGLSAQQLLSLSRHRPSYFYSRRRIGEKVRAFREAMPKETRLAYSIKANPFAPLVQYLVGMVDGVDVTSYKELEACLNAGVAPKSVMFAGPAKKAHELEAAISLGARISAESITEMDRIIEIAERLRQTAHVLLRVNPQISLRGASMRMGGAPTQFGIDEADLESAWRKFDNPSIRFAGIHIYWGSQCLSADAVTQAQTASVDLIEQLSTRFPEPPEKINLGGGFGVPYFQKDEELDLSAVATGFVPLQRRLSKLFPNSEVFLELGRYLVCEAGVYVCQVVDIKLSHGREYVVTDGGLHHFLAASGNFGQKIRRNFPLGLMPFGTTSKGTNGSSPTDTEFEVVGALCTPIDLLGHALTGPKVTIGDLIVVNCAGAYGRSASPVDFLSHDHPGEYLI